MKRKLLIQFSAVCAASMFLVFLSIQLIDVKRELRRHSSFHRCFNLHPKLDSSIYRFYGCADDKISIHLVSSDRKLEDLSSASMPSTVEKPMGLTNEPYIPSVNTDVITPTDAAIKLKVCPNKLPILIVISSFYSHTTRRTSIRSTWGADGSLSPRWNTLFVLAQGPKSAAMTAAKKEQKIFKDLIFGKFQESFYNLTHKVEMGFKWALKYCEFDYLLKGDDDVFVNVPNLISYLEQESTPREKLYTGNVNFISFVLRSGRYGVSKDEYSKKIYPRYCSGGGFVVSQDVVKGMVDRLLLFPNRSRLKIDDAYVGELALEIGVDVHPSNNFLMFESKCVYKPNAIVFHPVKQFECMRKLYMTSALPLKTTTLPFKTATTPPFKTTTTPPLKTTTTPVTSNFSVTPRA